MSNTLPILEAFDTWWGWPNMDPTLGASTRSLWNIYDDEHRALWIRYYGSLSAGPYEGVRANFAYLNGLRVLQDPPLPIIEPGFMPQYDSAGSAITTNWEIEDEYFEVQPERNKIEYIQAAIILWQMLALKMATQVYKLGPYSQRGRPIGT